MTCGQRTEPRQVLARLRFSGEPGLEQEAAEAWAFELTWYFRRGVGEAPAVTYCAGVYDVTGLIQTTHPGDRPGPDGIVRFTPVFSLAHCTDGHRREILRAACAEHEYRYDGREC